MWLFIKIYTCIKLHDSFFFFFLFLFLREKSRYKPIYWMLCLSVQDTKCHLVCPLTKHAKSQYLLFFSFANACATPLFCHQAWVNKLQILEMNSTPIKAAFRSSILGMYSRECISARMHSWKCIFSRMHFIENSAFGKILKLFIRSDYAEKNCV